MKFTLTSSVVKTVTLLLSTVLFISAAYAQINRTDPMLVSRIRPVPVPVIVKGPGALYVANTGSDMTFWLLTESNVIPVATVPLQTTPASVRSVQVELLKGQDGGITGVFYADNLTFSSSLTLSFSGTLDNTSCPSCTVIMPLKSDTALPWVDWLKPVTAQQTVVTNDNFSKILARQKEIYKVASQTMTNFEALKNNFVEMQKDSLTEYYQRIETSLQELNSKSQNSYTAMVDFENKLKGKAANDESKVLAAGTALQNSPSPAPEFSVGFNCGKLGMMTERTRGFVKGLRVDENDTDAGDSFDQRANQGNTKYDAQISAFESDSLSLLDTIEPCLNNLFVKYTAINENDPNLPVPDVAKANLISQTDYEALGKQIEEFAINAEKENEQWSGQLETRFNNLDRLASSTQTSGGGLGGSGTTTGRGGVVLSPPTKSGQIALQTLASQQPATNYLDLLKRAQSIASPILDYLSPTSKGASPVGNVAFSYDLLASKFGGSSSSPCGSGKYLSFDVKAVKVIIGTPWNDQITADDEINLVLALSGDDCVYAKGNYDAVFGMGDNDEIYGGDGHDFLFGDTLGFLNNGKDKIHGGIGEQYDVTAGPVTLTFDIGNFISGDGDADTLVGSGDSKSKDKYGYADVIIGDGFAGNQSGPDLINGDGGIDFLFGQVGDDDLSNTRIGRFSIDGVPVSCGSFFAGNEGNDKINGTNKPAILIPKSLGDLIVGGPENDLINAGDGDDFVFGDRLVIPSAGNDTINAGDGMDLVIAQQGDDTVHGDDQQDLLAGNAGNDILYSDLGLYSLMFGGPGNDAIVGNVGLDLIVAGVGDDKAAGGDGALDIIVGWDGIDQLNGEGMIDAIFGGTGNDVIKNGSGTVDLAFGGLGTDTIDGEAGVDVIFGNKNLFDTDRCGMKASANEYETLNGGDGIDFIFGGFGPDRISGGNGIDLLFGEDCHDVISGDNDVDVVIAGAGDDQVSGGGSPDVLFGMTGNDTLKGDQSFDLLLGGVGNDSLSGGADSDILLGGDGDDSINGDGDADLAIGGIGIDTIDGGSGINVLLGGDGDDTVNGGPDSDIILGGNQNDTLNGAGGSDVILGGDGDEIDIFGGDGGDLLFGGIGLDNIRGGQGLDIMFGGKQADTIVDNDNVSNSATEFNVSFGNEDNDSINTNVGRNFVFGGQGDDAVDLKDGGKPDKRDFGFGGSGNDTFYLNNWTDNPSGFTDLTF